MMVGIIQTKKVERDSQAAIEIVIDIAQSTVAFKKQARERRI